MKLIHKDADGRHVYELESGDRGIQNWGSPGNWYTMVIGAEGTGHSDFNFQNGAVAADASGPLPNGWTLEGVLAVVIHRLKILENRNSCIENQQSLIHLQAAFDLLTARSMSRIARGVDGTNKP